MNRTAVPVKAGPVTPAVYAALLRMRAAWHAAHPGEPSLPLPDWRPS